MISGIEVKIALVLLMLATWVAGILFPLGVVVFSREPWKFRVVYFVCVLLVGILGYYMVPELYQYIFSREI